MNPNFEKKFVHCESESYREHMVLRDLWDSILLLGHQHSHTFLKILAQLFTQLQLNIFSSRMFSCDFGNQAAEEVNLSSLQWWLFDVVDLEVSWGTSGGWWSSVRHYLIINRSDSSNRKELQASKGWKSLIGLKSLQTLCLTIVEIAIDSCFFESVLKCFNLRSSDC